MITALLSLFRCFKQHLIFVIAVLVLWSLARLGFIALLYSERVLAVDGLGFIILQGLRFDVIAAGILVLLPALLTLVMAPSKRSWPFFQLVLTVFFALAFALVLFMEMATPSFIAQFDVRPNILFVEYLKYPKEVFAMLTKAYALDLTLAAIIVPALTYGLVRFLRSAAPTPSLKISSLLLGAPLIIFVLLISIRSSLGHRPVNPSMVAFSSDLMVNSLALNSFYSTLQAVYASKKEGKSSFTYGTLGQEEVIKWVKDDMLIAPEAFTNTAIPTLHRQQALQVRPKPLNLVIVLQESLGAEFVGSLGGLPLTPNIDKLASEGIWFENFYATGTRSVRGIEAVITGFTPTPAQSVVKLQKSQTDFFTIAELLKRQGYSTSFIYGGEAHFDNMRSFFMGNGFSHIIEEKDFINPKFKGSWGVSDEDLFEKAHGYFSQQEDKPFFSLVFSSTNHTPFEYPDNTIEPYDAEKATVNNAVKYADHAVGQFIAKAKQSPYWDNTLIVVVADHNSRVYGSDLVPIERFHIPCLILGGAVQPERYTAIASQIDLVPTLLSHMGISSEHPAVGRDLLRPEVRALPGRTIMQYNDTQAFLQGQDVVILQRGKLPEQYVYSANKKLEPAPRADESLVTKALAFSLWGSFTYDTQTYRLPAE